MILIYAQIYFPFCMQFTQNIHNKYVFHDHSKTKILQLFLVLLLCYEYTYHKYTIDVGMIISVTPKCEVFWCFSFCWVVGSSSGIGRGTAVAFAKEGAKVTVTGRNVTDLEETAKLCEQAGAGKTDVCFIILWFPWKDKFSFILLCVLNRFICVTTVHTCY